LSKKKKIGWRPMECVNFNGRDSIVVGIYINKK